MKPSDRELRDREHYGSKGPRVSGAQQLRAAKRALELYEQQRKDRAANAKAIVQKIRQQRTDQFQAALENL